MLIKEIRKQWDNLNAVASGEVLGHEKCIKQLVRNVVRNVKFLSSRMKASQFTAEIASRKGSRRQKVMNSK